MELRGRSKNGFTLIELVAIIVLLSILSVAALSRLGGLGDFEKRGYFEDVVNALRYAQKLAVATGCNVQVTITASSYRLRQGDSCTSTTYNRNVLNPANRSVAYESLTPPDGLSISPAASFVFTPQYTTDLGIDTTFSIGGYQFTVFKDTGLVDVI